MGRPIVTEYMSVDGVIEAPGGSEGYPHVGWSFDFHRGPELEAFNSTKPSAPTPCSSVAPLRALRRLVAIDAGRGRRQVQRHAEVRRQLLAEERRYAFAYRASAPTSRSRETPPYDESTEAIRDALNYRIHTGADYDAVIDRDRALANPADSNARLSEYAAFDNLHPTTPT